MPVNGYSSAGTQDSQWLKACPVLVKVSEARICSELTEVSDNLITFFLHNLCKQQFSDPCNWWKWGRCAAEGYALCTGDIPWHIPDTKYRCAWNPCIDVRNLIWGINTSLSVFLLSNNELTRWRNVLILGFFARDHTQKMSVKSVKFWQSNKQIKMHSTIWSVTLQLQITYHHLFKKRGSYNYDFIIFSVIGAII